MNITIQKAETLDNKPLILIWFGERQVVLKENEFKDLKENIKSFETGEKETALEVSVQERDTININQLRTENRLEHIQNSYGDLSAIKSYRKEIMNDLKSIESIVEDADISNYKKADYIKALDCAIMKIQRIVQEERVKELLEKEANRAKENEKLIGIDPKSYLGKEILKLSREIVNLRGEIRGGLFEIKRRLK